MSATNSVHEVGNLTRDPELRTLASGQTVCEFAIAVDRPRRKGQDKSDADFFNVSAFGTTGENANRTLGKGARVAIAGVLRSRNWEDADGTKRSRVWILANDIEYLSPRTTRNDTAETQDQPDDGFVPGDQIEP